MKSRMRLHHLSKSSNKPSTSTIKKDKKIHAQSAQIKDLRQKLDQAVAENSQIRELLSPATLTTAFSNALSATKTRFTSQSGSRATNQNSTVYAKTLFGEASSLAVSGRERREYQPRPILSLL